LLAAAPIAAAQQSQPPSAVPQATNPAGTASVPQTAAEGADDSYHLGSGDRIHIGVFGQSDLNGDYVVDGGGSVQLPLIGSVRAAGLTVAEFQKQLISKYSDGYLVNPNVEVDVVNYRPFYIIGEIKAPGQYPYVNGMSILNAVALAGGFTDRADKSEVYIRRNGSAKEIEFPGDETTKVNPGDIVRISERFF
jgi:polysaccharide export outer membrane protein